MKSESKVKEAKEQALKDMMDNNIFFSPKADKFARKSKLENPGIKR